MTVYSLFGVNGNGATGPDTATDYGGSYIAGISFQVTDSPVYLEGYWWWVCPAGGETSAQTFALWSLAPNAYTAPMLVPGSTVTSGALSAGWNYAALDTPVPLAAGVPYQAQTGLTGNFPATSDQFGSGDPYGDGITNGPLTAYSDNGGSRPLPYGTKYQCTYSTAGSDPTSIFADEGSDSSFNSWLDIQVTDTVQAGTVYRAWPSYPQGGALSNDVSGYTLGMEFSLSQACLLNKIWHWSPPDCTVLPARCGIWDVGTATEVSGTDNQSPTWLLPDASPALAGDGWVYCDYSGSGVTLDSGTNYKVSTFYPAGAGDYWFGITNYYWSTGDGADGLSFGVLSVPDNAAADPGQNSWNTGTWAYPDTSNSPENDWVDVELALAGTPHTATASLTVDPSFASTKAQGHVRGASLTVNPVFASSYKGGAAPKSGIAVFDFTGF